MTPASPKTRANYLLVSEVQLLRMWGREVYEMFDAMPYLVGSAITRQDHRDVDVRVMLDPASFASLHPKYVERLNLAVSIWGQKVTGLPIDFQVQDRDAANAEFSGVRHAIGLHR